MGEESNSSGCLKSIFLEEVTCALGSEGQRPSHQEDEERVFWIERTVSIKTLN